MKKLLLLFVGATIALAVGIGLMFSGILLGAALVVIGLALFALYATLLGQKYHLAARRTWAIEREHDLALARIKANTTVTTTVNTTVNVPDIS